MTEDRGDSESIGALLLVAITVVSISILGGAVFAANSPTPHPNAQIDATADGSTLTVEHRAGEPLDAESFEVILRGAGTTFAGTDGDPVAEWSDADAQFEPGERWNFTGESTIASGETIALVYTDGGRVLLDETSLSGEESTTTTTTKDGDEEEDDEGDEEEKETTTQDDEEAEDGEDEEDGHPGRGNDKDDDDGGWWPPWS